MKIQKKDLVRLFFVVLSALMYALAMHLFVDSGGLFPGGFAGLGYMIVRVLAKYAQIHIPFGLIYFLLNIFPTVLVWKYVGKRFTIFSVIQYLCVSIFTSVLPEFHITSDPLLISVFGGIMAGFSISIALRHGASSGGSDFLAIYFANKYHKSTWNSVLACQVVLLILAGFLFGWNTALYSIIYQFCDTQVVNLRHDRYKMDTMFIVTQHPDEVQETLFHTARHGITVVNALGGFKRQDETLLIMTVNAFQTQEMMKAAYQADPHVFINVVKTERIMGNYYQLPLE